MPRTYPARLLSRDLWLVVIAALAGLNGTVYSPVYDSISYFLYNFARGSVFFSPALLAYGTSVLLALVTAMLAGIPAALYERVRGLRTSTPVSLAVWVATTLLLTWPTLRTVWGQD